MIGINFNKLLRKIQSFLAEKYKDIEIKKLNKENYQNYTSELEQLMQTDDTSLTNFLSPHGDFKKLYFDLTDLDIDEETKKELNIKDNNEIQNRLIMPSNYTEYLGFLLEDVVKVGFIGVAIINNTKEIYLKYNSLYAKPSTKLKNKLRDVFEEFDTIYCSLYDINQVGPGTIQKTISKNSGDTSEDLIAWFEDIYKNNNGE